MTTIYKIGGSCLRHLDDFKRIPSVLGETPFILIISATQNTTQILKSSLENARRGRKYRVEIDNLIRYHCQLNEGLSASRNFYLQIQKDRDDIIAFLHSVALLKEFSQVQQDWLLGYGEYWSSRMVADYLNIPWIDAGKIITVETSHSSIQVNWKATGKRLKLALSATPPPVVMPGFVGRTSKNLRALLGFNGSDFTAAIMAKLVHADKFVKWTNVDGIYSADPKLVKSAFAIHELSYEEATELAYFGAGVLHPQTMQPAFETKIPIYIKNFFKPALPGTLIAASCGTQSLIVKGLTSIRNLALIDLKGSGLQGLYGIAARLFTSLAKSQISVILISQASSEHSISVVIQEELAQLAQTTLEEEFKLEIASHAVKAVTVTKDCSIIAAVGDGMSGKPGTASRFFGTLAKANINILAIAQSSSERNISAVIASQNTQKAIRALHGGFYLSSKTISIGIIGPGKIGSTLLEQIKQNKLRIKRDLQIDLRVRGIMNSKAMLLEENPINLAHWEIALEQHGQKADLQDFIAHIASVEVPNAVIIDCTSANRIAEAYSSMFQQGCHVVTPNKKANSSSLSDYHQLNESMKKSNRIYLYEATVCAGLPIIKTIKDLLATGDHIKRIQGTVSGTLAYVFHSCSQGKSFAESVLEAHALGYTEPDPREDLTGLDVARKFVCLAREIGYEINLEEVQRLNLVPKALEKVSVSQFLKELPNHQDEIEQQIKLLLKDNVCIAYVGIIENGKIHIQLNGFPASHPFANTSGTDNILLIQSTRYDKQPLIIQGPGAGAEVTAAGVFADLLQLAAML